MSHNEIFRNVWPKPPKENSNLSLFELATPKAYVAKKFSLEKNFLTVMLLYFR